MSCSPQQTKGVAKKPKNNPYKLSKKQKENQNFDLKQAKEIVENNEKRSKQRKKDQLEEREKNIDQELEAAEAAEKEKSKFRKINSGKFMFY